MIVSHIDADGILSARILHILLERDPEVKVFFPEWDDFGIHERTVEEIRDHEPDTLYVADLGSDRESLEAVRRLVDEGVVGSVVWIDHHPPDCDLREFMDLKDFTIIHSEKTCAAGLAYQYAKMLGVDDEWAEIWAIVGIYGDAAEGGELSRKILGELRSKHPWMFGEQVFGNTRYKIPQMYTTYFNTPRRIAFHHGAWLAYMACEEVEEFGSLDLLKCNDPLVLSEYPYVMALQRMVDLYREIRRKVADTATVYDYGSFMVCIIHTPYDIGGYVASVYAGRYRKPVFCVNTGLPLEHIKITARAPESTQIDVGAVLRECFNGGGHRCAASAAASRDMSKEEIISRLVEHIVLQQQGSL